MIVLRAVMLSGGKCFPSTRGQAGLIGGGCREAHDGAVGGKHLL